MIRKMDLPRVLEKIRSFAPESLAEKWDNVGLLVSGTNTIHRPKILLTIDLNDSVLSEAYAKEVGLIVSYHPLIFSPIKKLTCETWKGRIICQCIEQNIAVYSPHTAWDAVNGGVTDWLVKGFKYTSKSPITPLPTDPTMGSGRIVQLEKAITFDELSLIVKNHLGVNAFQYAKRSANDDDEIRTIAVCAGSGGSVLRDVKADLYITGEMSHHEVLDAVQKGTNVLLTNHTNTERGFLLEFQSILQNLLRDMEDVEVIVAENDHDPLITHSIASGKVAAIETVKALKQQK